MEALIVLVAADGAFVKSFDALVPREAPAELFFLGDRVFARVGEPQANMVYREVVAHG